MAPVQYQWFVIMPYLAPMAIMPTISSEPRLAAMKARPVIQLGRDLPASR